MKLKSRNGITLKVFGYIYIIFNSNGFEITNTTNEDEALVLFEMYSKLNY